MIDGFALAITVVCLVAGATAAVRAGTGTFRWAGTAPTIALLELALLGQAVLDVVGLAGGHRPRETQTHLAYLVVSVLILPVAAVQTRHDDGRWSAALIALALLVTAVLVVRLQTTWRAAGG